MIRKYIPLDSNIDYESKIYTYRAHFHIEHLDTNTGKNTPLEKGENNSPLNNCSATDNDDDDDDNKINDAHLKLKDTLLISHNY